MFKLFLRSARLFWRAITFWLVFLGLFFAPKDTLEIPEIYPELFAWLAAIYDRETLLIGLLVLAGLWITWMDVRPLVSARLARERQKHPLCVSPHVHCETYAVQSADQSTTLYANRFFLVVTNRTSDGATLRRVQARVFPLGPPVLCQVRETRESSVDIRHGESGYFLLGKIVTENPIGSISGFSTMGSREREWSHNVPRGWLSFDLEPFNEGIKTGFGHRPEAESVWDLIAMVSADDVKSLSVSFKVNMADNENPVTLNLPN